MRKKNKTMRAAGALFLATMLTTSMTAGTFAKYTTGDSASDSARVAKFGVVVSAEGTLFGQQYADKDNGNKIISYSSTSTEGTVQVNATDGANGINVVAPGTKNDTGLGFSVTGVPEVDVNVKSTIKAKNIRLNKGSYGVMVAEDKVTDVNYDTYVANGLYFKNASNKYIKITTETYNVTKSYGGYYAVHNAVTLDKNYFPVIYKLESVDGTDYASGEFEYDNYIDSLQLVAKSIGLQLGHSATADYVAGSTVNEKLVHANTDLTAIAGVNLDKEAITWEWAFERTKTSGTDDEKAAYKEKYDNADTILGNLAAKDDTTFKGVVVKTSDSGSTYEGVTADSSDDAVDGDYNLKTVFNISITAVQVD
ncbi:MAG: hypothetical protein II919_00330 [Lachnospiraceae bacterium]|nr:hypothetical protein [Lachnospiraceae bacterium]